MTSTLSEQLTLTELPPDPLMVIEVTQSDIENGTPGDASSCAIAQVLLRKGFHSVQVATQAQWRTTENEWYWANLPPEADEFIRAYDKWGENDDGSDDHYDDCTDDFCDGCCESEYYECPEPLTFTLEVQAGVNEG